MADEKTTIGSQIANFNSKRFSVIVAAGYVIRDMALSTVVVPWYYPVLITIIAVTYMGFQSLSDKRSIKSEGLTNVDTSTK